MSALGSILMGAFGATYCVMGACMLVPGMVNRRWKSGGGNHGCSHEEEGPVANSQTRPGCVWLGALYPSVFKRFLQTEMTEQGGANRKQQEIGTGVRELDELEREDLAFRMLAYFVLFLGFLRVFVALHWSCSYVFLGLMTCLVEMAVVAHELLRHDAVQLHRVMSVLTELCVISLIFLGTALPHCRAT